MALNKVAGLVRCLSASLLSWLVALTALVLVPTLPVPVAAGEAPGEVRVAVLKNFPPQYLINKKTGKPDGFAIDVIERIAAKLKLKLRYKSYDTWPALIQAVRNNEVDLIPNLGITDDRKAFADFTGPVETFAIRLFVRAETSGIDGLNDLNRRPVSVVRENVSVRILRAHPDVNQVLHDSKEEALLALLSGRSDALVYPGSVLLRLARQAHLVDLIKTVGEPLLEIKRSVAVRKGQPELFAKVDRAVHDFVRSPEYESIFRKWYGASQPYWDARRVGILMGGLLALAIVTLGLWRYIAGVQFSRKLAATTAERNAVQDELSLHDRAIEAADTGILITDSRKDDNPIVYANPAVERMTGFAIDELIGRNPRVLQGDDRNQPGLGVLRSAIRDQKPAKVVLRNARKDGRQFLVDLAITPVMDSDGEVTHFIGIQHDVTEKAAIEEKLQQTQKMDALGELTGGIAHDFNNLLTVLRCNLALLRPGVVDEERRTALLKDTEDAVELGASLTNRLLTFARRQPLHTKLMDVSSFTAEMRDFLQRAIGETAEIRTLVANDPLPAVIDQGQYEAALLNLVINARDAMPGGGIITIESGTHQIGESTELCCPDADSGDYVFVRVSDTGKGMDTAISARAFEPFFSTKKAGKGTGLGLSMVYGFAQQSGGFATIDSAPGQGTRVTMYLRKAEEPAALAQVAE